MLSSQTILILSDVLHISFETVSLNVNIMIMTILLAAKVKVKHCFVLLDRRINNDNDI